MTTTVGMTATGDYTQWATSASHSDVTIQNRGTESVEVVIAAALAGAGDTGYLIYPGEERQFSGFSGVISGRAPFGNNKSDVVLIRS
jgi:predicted amidohydrolase